jgi:hypothetical protein
MKVEFPRQIFEKCPNMKFHDYALSGSRVPGRRTDMKLMVDFRNFANAPKKGGLRNELNSSGSG